MPDSLHKPLQFLSACKTMMQQHNYYFDPDLPDDKVQDVWLRFRQIYNYGEDCYLPYVNPLGDNEDSNVPPSTLDPFNMFLYNDATLCTMEGTPTTGTLRVPNAGEVLLGCFKTTPTRYGIYFKLSPSTEEILYNGFGFYITDNPLTISSLENAVYSSGGSLGQHGRVTFDESVPTENGFGAPAIIYATQEENGQFTVILEVENQRIPFEVDVDLYAEDENWLVIQQTNSERIWFINGLEVLRTPQPESEVWYTIFSPALALDSVPVAGTMFEYNLNQSVT
jgi:hypothetical protein